MQLLKTIIDSDFGQNIPAPTEYRLRTAARAVVFDNDGKIALLHATKYNYHKLPGGGVDSGESVEAGLARELLEEIGCVAQTTGEIGRIEEFRNKISLHQTSLCYLAQLVGEKGEPHLEPGEIAEGFKTEWMSLEDGVATLQAEAARLVGSGDNAYLARFMTLRDLSFLMTALQQSDKIR